MAHRKTRATGTRRDFLGATAAAAAGLAGVGHGPAPAAQSDAGDAREPTRETPERAGLARLTDHLVVYRGPINVGILRDGDKALLIDCGDGSVAAALRELELTAVEQILLTHHHRDQACGAGPFARRGTRIIVPAAERRHFEDVAAYWKDPKSRWHIYNLRPHHLMLAEPLRVDAALADGAEFDFGPAKIRALSTPGHTDGSVSYVVEVDGKRIVFCGDAIYDEGQVWDVHSLQKGIQTTDYHGFLGARRALVESLRRIRSLEPGVLVPSHGRPMAEPSRAIDALIERLDVCYDKYVAISALRHYFPKMFQEYAGRRDHMPIRKGKPVPACLRHFGTTWMLLSRDGAALVMDCGSPRVVQEVRKLLEQGEIRAVEGLWVTHYHDDHVDAIPDFQRAFDCPCITDRHVADVITDPMAWRLPCISPNKARVDRRTEDGQSWQWHEFKLTAFHFPGQTLYHAGLFVEGGGLRMLFVGDSFTMAGIDDYCTSNRNWLGRGVGFDRCLALVEKLRPTHIFNCHVDEAFDFTPEQTRFMRENLAQREDLYGRLVPWDHANYGMDEPWVRCHPYEQRATPGGPAGLRVVVTNHSSETRTAACRAVLPGRWAGAAQQATRWARAEVPAKSEGQIRLTLRVPDHAPADRYVIPVDLRFGRWTLPQRAEAIVVVS